MPQVECWRTPDLKRIVDTIVPYRLMANSPYSDDSVCLGLEYDIQHMIPPNEWSALVERFEEVQCTIDKHAQDAPGSRSKQGQHFTYGMLDHAKIVDAVPSLEVAYNNGPLLDMMLHACSASGLDDQLYPITRLVTGSDVTPSTVGLKYTSETDGSGQIDPHSDIHAAAILPITLPKGGASILTALRIEDDLPDPSISSDPYFARIAYRVGKLLCFPWGVVHVHQGSTINAADEQAFKSIVAVQWKHAMLDSKVSASITSYNESRQQVGNF